MCPYVHTLTMQLNNMRLKRLNKVFVKIYNFKVYRFMSTSYIFKVTSNYFHFYLHILIFVFILVE